MKETTFGKLVVGDVVLFFSPKKIELGVCISHNSGIAVVMFDNGTTMSTQSSYALENRRCFHLGSVPTDGNMLRELLNWRMDFE